MIGNVVFFYTGILPVLENDSGVAMVMSHEMGHTLAGHCFSGIARTALSAVLYCFGMKAVDFVCQNSSATFS